MSKVRPIAGESTGNSLVDIDERCVPFIYATVVSSPVSSMKFTLEARTSSMTSFALYVAFKRFKNSAFISHVPLAIAAKVTSCRIFSSVYQSVEQ